jgi:DnaJ-class molecular chaperone
MAHDADVYFEPIDLADRPALGLPESGPFSARDLTQKYRALAKRVHPDVPGGDKEQFITISTTYKRLIEHAAS